MSGTQDTPLAAAPLTAPAPRRFVAHLGLVVLLVVMGATAWLALDRYRDITAVQERFDASAAQEFHVQLELAQQKLETELDRLDIFLTSLDAFVTTSEQDADAAVDELIRITDAFDRFPTLRSAHVIEPGGAGALDGLDPAVFAGLPTTTREPTLTNHDLVSGDLISLSFDLDLPGRRDWVVLVFDHDAFLSRAITSSSTIDVTLVNTGRPFTTGPTTTPVLIAADGSLLASASIDVFGTEFVIDAVGDPDLRETIGYGSVWTLLGAGGVIAAGLYVALGSLSHRAASATASVQDKDRRLRAVDRRLKTAFDRAPIGMAEIDTAGNVRAVNAAMCAQIGLADHEIVGRRLSTMVHESDADAHASRIEALLAGETEATVGEHRYARADGHSIWVHESVSVIGNPLTDDDRALLVQSQDVTAQRRAAWELAQQALHDDLTGLPNRALFLNRLKHAMVRAARHQTQVAVMFIDIDRFKIINDTLGHEVGDQFLIQLAERLGRAIRRGDTVARFGGDEFVVLVDGVSGESEAAAAAQRISAVFAEPFDLGKSPTYATASIGITLSAAGDESADALLRDADAAMYRAKDGGRNRAELFDQSMRSNLMARMEIESQLREALTNGEIVMHYQAIVDPLTHLPAGYEALIRWNHPEKGLLGPGAFLGVAEEAGLIHLIDSFALRTTCRQIAEWSERFPAARNLYLATNWSARHLGRFTQQVEQVLAETGINPHQLVIEVTEGFLIEDSDASVLALNRLKQLGVQIAIDDFGTGYSSLSYLTQFAVDYLKIDQSFVSQLPESEPSAAVIGAIADLATRLGIKLVAEGVETDEQIAMLATLGAPRLQGYRFSKPRPAADIEVHLAARSGEAENVARGAESILAHAF